MALSNRYAWYIEGDNIALVELSTSGTDSNWSSISTADKTLRIYASSLATAFDSTLTDDDKAYNLDSRFRTALSEYVIAKGYELPESADPKMAGYFLNTFRNSIRQIKKSKNQNKRSGSLSVRQHSY